MHDTRARHGHNGAIPVLTLRFSFPFAFQIFLWTDSRGYRRHRSFILAAKRLHVDTLLLITIQVPARTIAEMREQRVYARLVLRIVEQELRFMVFSWYRVIWLHGYGPVRVAVGRHSVAEQQVISRVNNCNARQQEDDCSGK